MAEKATGVVVELETAPGSGVFAADERLAAERVESASGGAIGRAVIAVRLDDGFDAADARRRYNGDLRVAVRTSDTNLSRRRMLFEGYPLVQRVVRDGGPASPTQRYEIQAQQVYGRLARDPRAWVFGQRMRSGAILDGLAERPAEWAGESVPVTALPCVFNRGGRPNRAATPLTVVDGAGRSRRVAIFTHDGDASARYWSLADALRYLVWFHHLPEGPVAVTALLEATESAAGLDPTELGGYVPPSALVARLLAVAEEVDCEAMNLPEALALIAEQAGVHVACVTDSAGGRPASRLTAWAPEDGAEKPLRSAWGGRHADGSPRYEVRRLTAADVFGDNQVRRLSVTWDHEKLVNAPVIVGGVKRHEMTVELVPGWRPVIGLDNVEPADRDYAKSLALTPDVVESLGDQANEVPWYRRYHGGGAEHAAYLDVGRYWVLNEDGAFDGATYNRNPPFDDYRPFDFAAVAGDSVTEPGRWSRRPRPMQKPLTIAESGAVCVEVSYDAGVTWYRPVGRVVIAADRAGVRFELANPTAMVPPGGSPYETNLWYAIVDQVFRVRATAVFESDDRLVVRWAADGGRTPTLGAFARLVYKPTKYQFAGRCDVANVLAAQAPDSPAAEVDDTAAAERAAARIAESEQAGAAEAEAVIPWLDDEYAVGDRVTLGTTERSAWNVVGKTLVMAGGRWETVLKLARAAGRE